MQISSDIKVQNTVVFRKMMPITFPMDEHRLLDFAMACSFISLTKRKETIIDIPGSTGQKIFEYQLSTLQSCGFWHLEAPKPQLGWYQKILNTAFLCY